MYGDGVQPKLLVDLDIVCRKFGHLHDNVYYTAQDGHKERYIKDIQTYTHEMQLLQNRITRNVDPSPIEEVTADIDEFLIRIQEACETQDVTYFITVGSCFRYNIATIRPYKGNRLKSKKPFHYDTIYNYVKETYDPKYYEGLEADDLIGLALNSDKSIVASTDKDFDTLCCIRYNWDTNRLYRVSEHDALANFYQMILVGDKADNIPGLYGQGPKSAAVKKVKAALTEKEMFNIVFALYKKYYNAYAETFMLEVCSLLHILRGDSFKSASYWQQYFGIIEKDIYSKVGDIDEEFWSPNFGKNFLTGKGVQ